MLSLELTESVVGATLRRYEELFGRRDVEGIVAGFADDAYVRYSNFQPLKGKEKLRAFLVQRFARLKDYRLKKRLEVLQPPRFAASWTAEWIDADTKIEMEGFGTEILTVREGLFVEWIANLSTWKR